MIVGGQKKVFLRDVNHDGTFEKLIIYYGDIMPRIGIYTPDDKVYGETSLRGFIKPENTVGFCDVNNDSIDEAFTITRRNDSLFLTIAELNLNSSIGIKNRFLFTIRETNGQPDWTAVSEYFFSDINNDRCKDVVFSYSALYSVFPRCVIAYNPIKDSIVLSPFSGIKSSVFEIIDYNNDGYQEIFISTSTSENIKDTASITIHDHTPWLMILDHKLQFITTPKPFNVKPATFIPFILPHGDTISLTGYLTSYGQDNLSSTFFLFNTDFNVIMKKDVASYPVLYFCGLLRQNYSNNGICLVHSKSGTVFLYDHTFNLYRKIILEPGTLPLVENNYIRQVTINKKSFYVFQNHTINSGFLLLNDKFNRIARIDYPESFRNDPFAHHQIYQTNDGRVKFFIHAHDRLKEYDVTYEKFWWLNYWRYPAFYTLMLGLIIFLQYLFKLRIEQHKKIENEILGLQLKSTLNQLDPHFTFNALNMISGLITCNRREEANTYLIQFSKLMRATVSEGEKIMITLEQELNFVKDYLIMQKMRIVDDFNYLIDVPKDINQSIMIPKRIIHSHAENALKHGLMHKEGPKRLEIKVSRETNALCIVIIDNGIGRERAGKINPYQSTGQGLRITNQILELSGSLNHKKYEQKITDVKDIEGNISGTKVELRIEM